MDYAGSEREISLNCKDKHKANEGKERHKRFFIFLNYVNCDKQIILLLMK